MKIHIEFWLVQSDEDGSVLSVELSEGNADLEATRAHTHDTDGEEVFVPAYASGPHYIEKEL